jgi:hypothetical protein
MIGTRNARVRGIPSAGIQDAEQVAIYNARHRTADGFKEE